MATLTTITTGMEKGPEAINQNDVALNQDIATLTAGQNLTWMNLPLSSGITGYLQVAAGYGGIVYIKGQIRGNFPNGMVLAKTAGTSLASLAWVNTPVVASNGIASFQVNDIGNLSIQGLSGAATQLNASGLFAE